METLTSSDEPAEAQAIMEAAERTLSAAPASTSTSMTDLVVADGGSRRAHQVDGLGRGAKSDRGGVADQGQPAPLGLSRLGGGTWPPGDDGGPRGRRGQLCSGTHGAFNCAFQPGGHGTSHLGPRPGSGR